MAGHATCNKSIDLKIQLLGRIWSSKRIYAADGNRIREWKFLKPKPNNIGFYFLFILLFFFLPVNLTMTEKSGVKIKSTRTKNIQEEKREFQ